jgi:hypothetical protein
MSEIEFAVDSQRTRLQKQFFAVFSFDSSEQLLAAISEMEVGLHSIAQSLDSRNSVYSGWVYWFLYVKGYLQFAESNQVDDDNIYLGYLVRYYAPRGHDPGVAQELSDLGTARERVKQRFLLIPEAAEAATSESKIWNTRPVLVILDEQPPRFPLLVYPVGSAQPVGASLVDGWHRLFAARVSGVAAVPGQLVRRGDQEQSPKNDRLATPT